jgi:maleamate amidohydrolase
MGFGKKPAVIVIDLQLGFTDPTCPLGGDLDRVVDSCRELIFPAHQNKSRFSSPPARTKSISRIPGSGEKGSRFKLVGSGQRLGGDRSALGKNA